MGEACVVWKKKVLVIGQTDLGQGRVPCGARSPWHGHRDESTAACRGVGVYMVSCNLQSYVLVPMQVQPGGEGMGARLQGVRMQYRGLEQAADLGPQLSSGTGGSHSSSTRPILEGPCLLGCGVQILQNMWRPHKGCKPLPVKVGEPFSTRIPRFLLALQVVFPIEPPIFSSKNCTNVAFWNFVDQVL